MSDTPQFTDGPWAYGVRPDGTIWLSIGDRITGPHYQGEFVGSEADARLTVAGPAMFAALQKMLDRLGNRKGLLFSQRLAVEEAKAAIVQVLDGSK